MLRNKIFTDPLMDNNPITRQVLGISSALAVSVKVGNKMEKAIFKPDYGNRGFLEGVVKSVKLNKHDIIYSSGLGEIYPPDIPVCKILEISNDDDKPYQNVIVEILADLTNLNYVFVIQ